MSNHTIDCQYCGEDMRLMDVTSVDHENTCEKRPKEEKPQTIDALKIDETVGEYVAIRDKLSRTRKKFKEFELRCKDDMEIIEVKLLEIARILGVLNFKTIHGTAMVVDKDFARVGGPEGWEKLTNYMKETGDFGLVEKRVAKLHFKEVMEKGKLSPQDLGVEYVIEKAVQIRRS